MGRPYSDDLRERVVAAIESGYTRKEVAELFNMALSTVGGFIRRKRETGSVSPDKFGGYKTFSLEPHADLVKKLVAEQPDSTLAELQVRLAKESPDDERTRPEYDGRIWPLTGERQHDLECVERTCSDIAENDAQCRQGENGVTSERRAAVPDQSRQCKHVATPIAIDLDRRTSLRLW
jgi:transposase-like protein